MQSQTCSIFLRIYNCDGQINMMFIWQLTSTKISPDKITGSIMFLELNSALIFREAAHLQADEWVPWCQLLCTTLWTEGCPRISNDITSLGLQSCAAVLHYVQIPHCSLVQMCPTWRPPGWVMWPMATFVNYTYIHATQDYSKWLSGF